MLPGNEKVVVHVHTARFFSVYFLKNPLDKLNFVVDTKNLSLWERQLIQLLPVFHCGFVCLFILFCFVLLFKIQCSLKNKTQINYGLSTLKYKFLFWYLFLSWEVWKPDGYGCKLLTFEIRMCSRLHRLIIKIIISTFCLFLAYIWQYRQGPQEAGVFPGPWEQRGQEQV